MARELITEGECEHPWCKGIPGDRLEWDRKIIIKPGYSSRNSSWTFWCKCIKKGIDGGLLCERFRTFVWDKQKPDFQNQLQHQIEGKACATDSDLLKSLLTSHDRNESWTWNWVAFQPIKTIWIVAPMGMRQQTACHMGKSCWCMHRTGFRDPSWQGACRVRYTASTPGGERWTCCSYISKAPNSLSLLFVGELVSIDETAYNSPSVLCNQTLKPLFSCLGYPDYSYGCNTLSARVSVWYH